MPQGSERADVTVIGGGLAGMAASIHLAKAGLRVLCVSPDPAVRPPLGESLDWAAPALLAELGLPLERLLSRDMATFKRHVTLQTRDGSTRDYAPGEWLARPPYNVEIRTLHVDRGRLDPAIRDLVLEQGVQTLDDRAVDVMTEGRRVAAIRTSNGRTLTSRWFIDASGSGASLFPRKLRLPVYEYGPKKVAMWSYFDVMDTVEGTTLYMDGTRRYMEWVWEIPIRAGVVSIGYVSPGDSVAERRRKGKTMEQIFREHLSRMPRFARLLGSGSSAPHVTSFQCRVHGRLVGPNWIVTGEAACMVDPMTANGVTTALRHAAEAAALVVRAGTRSRLPLIAGALYTRRVVDMGRFFNSAIERIVYEEPVRRRIGLASAGRAYTVPAWVMNAVYSRTQPRGVVGTLLFGVVVTSFRMAAVVYTAFCRKAPRARRKVA